MTYFKNIRLMGGLNFIFGLVFAIYGFYYNYTLLSFWSGIMIMYGIADGFVEKRSYK